MNSRAGLIAALGAMAMMAAPSRFEDPLGIRVDMLPDDDLAYDGPTLSLAPRPPRGVRASKYVPHQGKREMERRARRLAKQSA